MMIVKINRKLIKASLFIALIFSLGFNILSYFQNRNLIYKYESIICISNQLGKTGLISFMAATEKSSNKNKAIEIFDIEKGEVVKKVQQKPSIQKIANGYLKGISGMYVKVKAFPDRGYIIRIPLYPSIDVKNHWLNDYGIYSVDEVFILFPAEGNPFLLVLDEKSRPLFYNFTGNTGELLKELEFNMEE